MPFITKKDVWLIAQRRRINRPESLAHLCVVNHTAIVGEMQMMVIDRRKSRENNRAAGEA